MEIKLRKVTNPKKKYLTTYIFSDKDEPIPQLDIPENYRELFNAKSPEDPKYKDALFVFVLDAFSYSGSLAKTIMDGLKDKNLLLVINKIDLLPRNTDLNVLKEHIKKYFLTYDINISDDRIFLNSALDIEGARAVMEKIYLTKNNHDVYIVGSKYSGKHTLVDSFLKIYNNLSHEYISRYIECGLEILKIPFNKKTALYNVEGYENPNSLLPKLSKATFHQVAPKRQVKNRAFPIDKKYCLFVGGFAILEPINKEDSFINCYFSDNVTVDRVMNIKMLDRFLVLNNTKLLKPSFSKIKKVEDFDVYYITLTEDKIVDISILGLGWITLKSNNQQFRLYVPKGVAVHVGSSKINKIDKK